MSSPLSRILGDSSGLRPSGSSGGLRGPENDDHGANAARDQFFELQSRVQSALAAKLQEMRIDVTDMPQAQAMRLLEEWLHAIIDEETARQGITLTNRVRATLFERTAAELIGMGPIDPLLADATVTEIMINGPRDVYVIREGKMIKTDVQFRDDQHLMKLIYRIVSHIGRRVDETSPMVDARLPDRSRVNIIIPPVALDGPTVTIRKFPTRGLQPQDLIEKETITADMLHFLEACVRAHLNIIVSGGTNSGKSTLLNVLSVFIPSYERIVTIEDSAELRLQQSHVIRLESRPMTAEGKNGIAIRELLANALRMTPNRIIIGECRGGEALDMLQAMNTGHEGSMTTLHANSSADVVSRLETLVLMGGLDLPARAIQKQISSAIHLIVHMHLFEDGKRRVSSIAEVQRTNGENVQVDDIFEFEARGFDANGKVLGQLRPTGHMPKIMQLLDQKGLSVPMTIFNR